MCAHVCACLCEHKWRPDLHVGMSSSFVSPPYVLSETGSHWTWCSLFELDGLVTGSLVFVCLFLQHYGYRHIPACLVFYMSRHLDSGPHVPEAGTLPAGPSPLALLLSLISLLLCSVTLNIPHTLPWIGMLSYCQVCLPCERYLIPTGDLAVSLFGSLNIFKGKGLNFTEISICNLYESIQGFQGHLTSIFSTSSLSFL